MASTEYLRDAAAPLLAASGLELWDVEMAGDVVRFLVDKPGGVDLDALSEASTILSPLLDAHDELVPAGRYQLEVSSPGVERTLRTPDQYERFVGSTVAVKTAAALDGARRFRGTLSATDADGFTVTLDDAAGSVPERNAGSVPERNAGSVPERNAGTTRTFRYDQVERTLTVLVWGPPPKAGTRTRKGPRKAAKPPVHDSPNPESTGTKDPA